MPHWYCALIKDRYNKPMYMREIEESIKNAMSSAEVRLICRDFGSGVRQNLVENYVFIKSKDFVSNCHKLKQSKFIETVFPSYEEPAVIPSSDVNRMCSHMEERKPIAVTFGDIVKVSHGIRCNLYGVVVGLKPGAADVLFKLFRGCCVAEEKIDNLTHAGNLFKNMKFPTMEDHNAGCHRHRHRQHRVRRRH